MLEKRELDVLASLLAEQVGLRLQPAIAANVLDVEAVRAQHAADQKAPVTAARILLTAQQRYPELPQIFFQSRQAFLKQR